MMDGVDCRNSLPTNKKKGKQERRRMLNGHGSKQCVAVEGDDGSCQILAIDLGSQKTYISGYDGDVHKPILSSF
jgi:hypothetical protein